MKTPWRGLSLALIQVVIVASLGGKLLYDRAHYPRVWVKTAPVDPKLPIRGRYLRLGVVVDASAFPADDFTLPASGEGSASQSQPVPRQMHPGRLVLEHGRLVAEPAPSGEDASYLRLWRDDTGSWAQPLVPLAFFIPEHAPDPSIREQGETLWVEVTVTPSGGLRPLRLGVKKDGRMTPVQN
ncbi:MAG: hypothetical protein WAO20_00525 [Acidobacteriota bacterium]